MSEPFDLLAALNKPSPVKAPAGPVPPSFDLGVSLGEGAIGNVQRLALTPTQAKEKLSLGKLFLRKETNTYKLGKPERPTFIHDNGHRGKAGQDMKPLRKPTEEDKQAFRDMFTYLQVSELMCNDREEKNDWWWENRQRMVRECGGNEPDANLALRNFLFGKGRSRNIDYERCLRDEDQQLGQPPGTHKIVRLLVADFMPHAEAIGTNRTHFSVTSKQMYAIGPHGFADEPTNWNWRRTIGAHQIWVSAEVIAASASDGSRIQYVADLTLHIEDMYNFNPGSSDGRMNVNDSVGGRLEMSGLATQFMTYATIYRHIKWDEKKPESVKISMGSPPPGAVIFKEDYAKEEAELSKAQKEARVVGYPNELAVMAEKAFARLFSNK